MLTLDREPQMSLMDKIKSLFSGGSATDSHAGTDHDHGDHDHSGHDHAHEPAASTPPAEPESEDKPAY